jgi:hypothetical protein
MAQGNTWLDRIGWVAGGPDFDMLIFIIARVYMATMGPKPSLSTTPMVTGYEDLEGDR